ncbi:MAG TPA: ABC-ATPase domain-containing protein [Clostridiaceae bacterium]|nr:ABC-ATPase domain-containing protein [Clostridiaceae bacterium]
MKSSNELQQLLYSIDGRGYSAYKSIKGEYNFGKYVLTIDHVQPDPFAPPSKSRIIISREEAGFPDELLNSKEKIIAVSDFLTRAFRNSINHFNSGISGTGKSGLLTIDRCGQEMLERTSVLIRRDRIEARFEIGLPAAGRRVLGKAANSIFVGIIPKIVTSALVYKNVDQVALKKQVDLIVDQEYIRRELRKRGLIAFIANGSVLPRESGISDRPLKGAIPFKSPESLELELVLPNRGPVKGMGIPEGITLIVGGGYHGKSTLLRALELGVYNHIMGDGRELAITVSDAVKIRAEDGRSVEKVNISPFVNNLPNNKDTQRFTTENASGSTSQAANVMEALEAGATVLLIDEDTSATNFMIRDWRMRQLVSKDKEPITPFIDRIRQLYEEHGVSTVLVVGGSGDYFDVADRVILMNRYVPEDVTKAAKEIAKSDKDTVGKKNDTEKDAFGSFTPRIPLRSGFANTGRDDRIKSKGLHNIVIGKAVIDLSSLEQLVDDSQTNCIAVMLDYLRKNIFDEKISLSKAVDVLLKRIESTGLDSISPYTGHPGNLALPRKFEICAAINRYRGLKVLLDE